MTRHKLVQAASATRAPGCLTSFPWSRTDKHIPLRPDVAGRGQKPVYKKTQREWGGLCKLCDCILELLCKVKRVRLLRAVPVKLWIKPHPFFYEAIRAGYSETARKLKDFLVCMCARMCVAMCACVRLLACAEMKVMLGSTSVSETGCVCLLVICSWTCSLLVNFWHFGYISPLTLLVS